MPRMTVLARNPRNLASSMQQCTTDIQLIVVCRQTKLTRACRSREGFDLVEVHYPDPDKAVVTGAGHQLAVLLIQAHVTHLHTHTQAAM